MSSIAPGAPDPGDLQRLEGLVADPLVGARADAPAGAPAAAPGGPAALQLTRLSRRRARRGPGPADRYDAQLEKGIAGEQRVGADLESRLAGSKCVVLHSIRFKRWGDIDHVVIGPGGITVIDAKNWSGTVTVVQGAPAADGRRRGKELGKLEEQCAGVRLALLHARPDLRLANVQGVLCLAAEPDRWLEPLSRGLVIGGSAAAAAHAARPGMLSADDIGQIRAVLERQLPRVHRSEIDDILGLEAMGPEAGGSALPTARGDRRSPAPGPARIHRRQGLLARRALTGMAILLLAFATIGALSKLRLAFRAPQGATLAGLRVDLRHGAPVVSFRTAPGTLVTVQLQRRRHRYVTEIRAGAGGRAGASVWRVPHAWRRARHFTVLACTSTATGGCSGRVLRASLS